MKKTNLSRRSFLNAASKLAAISALAPAAWPTRTAQAAPDGGERREVYFVPNFHPGCMGWLVRYSEERNHCLYNYLTHLDRVAADPRYRFVFSEIPHLITMMELEPARVSEFRRRLDEGRVEIVNANVLEATVNLSGGEALVQQGVQGLRWYREIMNVRPRYYWAIDICGWHEQMAQIVKGLGLDAFVYCRFNPTGPAPKTDPPLGNEDGCKDGMALHWAESPDGTRVLALNSGHYSDPDYRSLVGSERPVSGEELLRYIALARSNAARYPQGLPLLLLGGEADYSMPFRCKTYPSQLLDAWNAASPDLRLRVATLSEYVDAIQPRLKSGEVQLPSAVSSSRYGWSAFWVSMPWLKQWYRRTEHGMCSAEALATCASLTGGAAYPSQDMADAWFLMALNTDRNILWGCGADDSFCDRRSWDVRDRFEGVEARVAKTSQAAIQALTRADVDSLTLFHAVNWTRSDPFELALPPGRVPVGLPSQVTPDGRSVLVKAPLPSVGLMTVPLGWTKQTPGTAATQPASIETAFYTARIDPATGALASLKLKHSGRELLGGPANVILAESKSDVHNTPEKAARKLIADSNGFKPFVTTTRGELATIVAVRGAFYSGGELRRTIRFYHDSPRIDFVTETNDVPAGTILSAVFPFAETITEVRRGVPYGFSFGSLTSERKEHQGITQGITPAIRWSDYTLAGGGGAAILDRGVPARELVGNTAILLLHNICDAYGFDWPIKGKKYGRPSIWYNHGGRQSYEYALVVREQAWDHSRVPQMAWEYNSPVTVWPGRAAGKAASFVETSDNLIVEALRRDGGEIEVRMVECLGKAGTATIKVNLPHTAAAISNLVGGERQPLAGNSSYSLDVRPQQIVTLRLRTDGEVPSVAYLKTFETLIPPGKREFMRTSRRPDWIGHPPSDP